MLLRLRGVFDFGDSFGSLSLLLAVLIFFVSVGFDFSESGFLSSFLVSFSAGFSSFVSVLAKRNRVEVFVAYENRVYGENLY